VVISGESGSGKTEAAKMVLNHIVNRGNTNSVGISEGGAVSSLEERLMKSSPLLEAFGNAKSKFTFPLALLISSAAVRNSNSSRFGKYIRMFFHPLVQDSDRVVPIAQCVRKIAGATIETYLLEKSRVTSHAPEERNYHVFYYLVLAKGLVRSLLLTPFL
jgi:myosin heavy subunit